MIEKVPWWRRVIQFALGGIRSGFGLFSRNGKTGPGHEAAQFAVEEERSVTPEIAEIQPMIADSVVDVAEPEAPIREIEIDASETVEPVHDETEIREVEVNDSGIAESEIAEAERIEIENNDEVETRVEPVEDEAGEIEAKDGALGEIEASLPDYEIAEPEVAEVDGTRAEDTEEVAPGTEPAEIELNELEEKDDTSVEVEPIADRPAEPERTETKPAESILGDCEVGEAEAAEVKQAPSEPENSDEEDSILKHSSPQSEAVAAQTANAAEPVAGSEAEPTPNAEADRLADLPDPTAALPETEAALKYDSPNEPLQSEPTAPVETESAGVAVALAPEAAAAPTTEVKPEAPKPTAESATAQKVAAALKARGEDAEQSPFSVVVEQVYDGPLDLLLDLIRKQDIDIYDIPIAKITAQFLAYVDRLRASDMDVAGEFIYTAALLIHIKSKMLLPRAPVGPDDQVEDPRRELVERLLEHERFKNAAQMLHERQMLEAATWTNPGVREFREDANAEPEIAADTTDLVRVFREILDRARNRPILDLQEESVTVGQMIQFLTRRLTMEDRPVALRRLLSHTRSERALIAMFLAVLELVRLQAILLRQDKQFSEIFIKKHSGFEAAVNQGMADAQDDWR